MTKLQAMVCMIEGSSIDDTHTTSVSYYKMAGFHLFGFSSPNADQIRQHVDAHSVRSACSGPVTDACQRAAQERSLGSREVR